MADPNQQNTGVSGAPSTHAIPKNVCPSKGHIDSLRECFAHLESELQLASESCHDIEKDAVVISDYDALLLSGHCAAIAYYALKVGCDIFKLVENPREPILAESKRVFKLGMPVLRLSDAIDNVSKAKQEELAHRKPSWALPAGLVTKYLYNQDEFGDITLVQTPPRNGYVKAQVDPGKGRIHTPPAASTSTLAPRLASPFLASTSVAIVSDEKAKKNDKEGTSSAQEYPRKKIKQEL